jgi:hypothetical protein
MEITKEMCHDGRTNIKKAGVQWEWTKWELEEVAKCAEDPAYFMRKYVKIIDLDRGLVNFDLFPYQEEMLDCMHNNRFAIMCTARQMGKTTLVAAYLLWAAIFNDSFTIAILANKADQSREIMSRLQLMYENLPFFLQPGVKGWNKGDIYLANESKIFCAATSGSSIRGRSVNLVYLDEFAFVQNDLEFYTSTYPVVTAGQETKVIITSTPKGMNLFYKLWSEAKTGKNDYKWVLVPWDRHPRRDQSWKDQQLRNMSQKQFDQEFECEFFGSENTLISGKKLQTLTFNDPTGGDQYYSVYDAPRMGHSYVVTVDTAEGIGMDYSVVSVIDVTCQPFTQVAKYRDNTIPPLMLAEVAYKIGMSYNEAAMVVETNSVGGQVANSIWYDFEYENMVTSKVKLTENVENVSGRAEIGVRTTSKTKLVGCSTLKSLIESDTLLIQDFDTVSELTTFIKKGNKYQAEENKFDDIVMSLVMFAWFTAQPNFEEVTNVEIRSTLRSRLDMQEDLRMSWGFFDDGTEF